MIGDPQLKVATLYDMLPDEAGDTSEGRTAADNAPVRAVFFIGPDKRVKAMLTYPMTSGCNFDEVLRLLDSLQLTAAHPVATPVNWRQGDDVIIVTSVSDEQARKKFPGGWKTLKPYVRIVCRRRFFSSKRWAWKRSGEAFPGLLANCSLSELLEECPDQQC
jgi:hypothetical protein